MKNVFKTFAVIAIVAAIGFSLAACDNNVGSSGGILTVAGTLPGTRTIVSVYPNLAGELNRENVQATRRLSVMAESRHDNTSPFNLVAIPGGDTFRRTGTFMVVFLVMGSLGS